MGLAEDHINLVKVIAKQTLKTKPVHMELDDLVSAGYLGLVEAERKYDPDKGIPFKSFASWRIYGAMLDSMRKDDYLTRWQRRSGDYDMPVSLDRLFNEHGKERADYNLYDLICAEDDRGFDQVEVEMMLKELLPWLDERKQWILLQRFYLNRSLAAIGKDLGVSESAVSLAITNMLRKLRKRIEEPKTCARGHILSFNNSYTVKGYPNKRWCLACAEDRYKPKEKRRGKRY